MDAIIFDVDGTLWDSTDEVAVSWNQAIKDHTDLEIELTGPQLEQEFGKPLEEIVEHLFPMLNKKEQEELAVHMYQYENKAMETAPCRRYEGLEETFAALSEKYPLFIVSNCQAGYIEAFLMNTKLGKYVTDHNCPGDTGKLKGDNIRILMEKHQIKKAVYVGDTQGDANACKQAGIPMIYAAYGFGQVDGEYVTIQSLSELIDMDYSTIE